MLNLTTPLKIGLAAACLVVVAIIIAVDVARTRGAETPVAQPSAAAATAIVEALPPAFQPPKPSADAVICPAPPALPAAEAPKPVAAPEPVKEKVQEEPPKTYTITQGDTLYGISQKMFGTPRHYERIYEMNKDRIKDPNTLQVGINLRMPDVAVKPA
jgi:nucleoid-associated protein YgaU